MTESANPFNTFDQQVSEAAFHSKRYTASASFALTEEDLETLREIAKARSVSLSTLLRIMTTTFLTSYKQDQ